MRLHDQRLDDYPASDFYIACWNTVMFYTCPTCGSRPGDRCLTSGGNTLSITNTHVPRRNLDTQP